MRTDIPKGQQDSFFLDAEVVFLILGEWHPLKLTKMILMGEVPVEHSPYTIHPNNLNLSRLSGYCLIPDYS